MTQRTGMGNIKKTPHHRNTIMHLDGVAMLCAFIGLKRGLEVEICRYAGILHDLWLFCHIRFILFFQYHVIPFSRSVEKKIIL